MRTITETAGKAAEFAELQCNPYYGGGKDSMNTADIGVAINDMLNAMLNGGYVGEYVINAVVSWVRDNRNVGDVFGHSQIVEHVRDYCEIDDVFSSEEVVKYVAGEYMPCDIFSKDDLELCVRKEKEEDDNRRNDRDE